MTAVKLAACESSSDVSASGGSTTGVEATTATAVSVSEAYDLVQTGVVVLALSASACGLFTGYESPAADALHVIASDFDAAGVVEGSTLKDRSVETMCDRTPSGSSRETVFILDGTTTSWDEFRDYYVGSLEAQGWEVVGQQDDRVDLAKSGVADEYDGIAFVVRRYPPPDYALVGQVWGDTCCT